jgi:phosphate transport system permease protein
MGKKMILFKNRALRENLIKTFFLISSITAIATLAGIAFFLFKEAFPTFLTPHATSIHALVPVVHRENQIWKKSINKEKLKDIYTGKLTDWKMLDGKSGKIQVISYSETTYEGKKWLEGLLGEETLAKDAIKVESARQMTRSIATNKNAIGYLDREEIGRITREFKLTKRVGVLEFLFGKEWYPPPNEPPSFQIFPILWGSIIVTFFSALIAIPLGVGSAIYMSEIAHTKTNEILKPIIELFAALPSVVIGFFGMVIVAPLLQKQFDIPNGLNLTNASILLAFMAVPTIASVSEDALRAVPESLKEASYALGSTQWETTWRVTVPAALSGISAAVILGLARAMGETMVVLMVAGGAAMIPDGLFDPVRPMPAAIAAEMGEAPRGGMHYHALFAIGVTLFILTFCFNLLSDFISKRYKEAGASAG